MNKDLLIELTQISIIPTLDELSKQTAKEILPNGSNYEIAALRQAFVSGFIEDRFSHYFDKIADSSVRFFNYLGFEHLSPEQKALVKNMYYWNVQVGRKIALESSETEFASHLKSAYENGDLITDPFTDDRSLTNPDQIPEKLIPYEEALLENIKALFLKLNEIAHQIQLDDVYHLHNQMEILASEISNKGKKYGAYVAHNAEIELQEKIANIDESLSDGDKVAERLQLTAEYNNYLQELSDNLQDSISAEISKMHHKYEEKIAYTLEHIEIYEEISKHTLTFSEELTSLNGLRQFYDECAILSIYRDEYHDYFI